MTSMFTLFFTHHEPENERYKLLGIFSSEEGAREAIKRYTDPPWFRDCPDGFAIDEHIVGQSQWTEGFGIDLPDDG